MSNQVLNDGAPVYYAVLQNGRVISQTFTDRFAAEQHRQNLPPTQQKLTEVQPVDSAGRQVLLG